MSPEVDFIMKEVIIKLGVPSIIHAHQGRQFEGQLFTEMCKNDKFLKWRAIPCHLQSNGTVVSIKPLYEVLKYM